MSPPEPGSAGAAGGAGPAPPPPAGPPLPPGGRPTPAGTAGDRRGAPAGSRQVARSSAEEAGDPVADGEGQLRGLVGAELGAVRGGDVEGVDHPVAARVDGRRA